MRHPISESSMKPFGIVIAVDAFERRKPNMLYALERSELGVLLLFQLSQETFAGRVVPAFAFPLIL